MKILQVHKFYYHHRGAENYVLALSELLRQHGHEVIPWAMADVRNLPSPYQDYFVKHLELDHWDHSWSSVKKAGAVIYNRQAQKDAERLLAEVKPDLVHLHNIYHHFSPSILPVFKEFGLPVVMTVHDFKLICPNYLLYCHGRICQRCRPHRYYQCLLHRCVKGSLAASAVATAEAYLHYWFGSYRRYVDQFLAPSQFVKNLLVAWGWPAEKISVLPHFVSAAATPSKKVGDYLLFIGALRPEKGLAVLLKTLYTEKLAYPLWVAGDGPERQRLEKLTARYGLTEQVKFLGQVPPAELIPLIRQSRLVVVPSLYYETFGLSALEALAQGKPVLVSALGALPEIVAGRAVGQIFDPTIAGSLARALGSLLALPNKELLALGRRGWQLVKAEYSPEEHYRRLMEVYEKVKVKS